jgi:copper chaperone CopZ
MVELRVTGMHCGSCATRITQAVQQIEPTALVEVDVPSQRVRVSGLAGEQARAVIESAGYAARLVLELQD